MLKYAKQFDPVSYSAQYPMAPPGGVFVAVIGVSILLGSLFPSARISLVWVGFPLATITLLASRELAAGQQAPTAIQLGSLVVAIVLEVIAFIVVMPRVRPRGERAAIIAALAIVGTHFLIMFPAFGPLIAVLAVLCLVNAGVAAATPKYSNRAAWFVDGLLKLTLGAAMLWTSQVVLQLTRSSA